MRGIYWALLTIRYEGEYRGSYRALLCAQSLQKLLGVVFIFCMLPEYLL